MAKSEPVERIAYSVKEVAQMLGLSEASVNVYIKEGTIPSVKLGGRRLIRRDVLDALLAGDEPGEGEDSGGEVVGLADIAHRLGVSRATVDQWKWRGVMPKPTQLVSGRPAWNWEVIEAWARKTKRLPKKS
jgi:excisionase family DNA binding protein